MEFVHACRFLDRQHVSAGLAGQRRGTAEGGDDQLVRARFRGLETKPRVQIARIAAVVVGRQHFALVVLHTQIAIEGLAFEIDADQFSFLQLDVVLFPMRLFEFLVERIVLGQFAFNLEQLLAIRLGSVGFLVGFLVAGLGGQRSAQDG